MNITAPFIDLDDDSFLERIAGMTPAKIEDDVLSIAEKTNSAFPVVYVGPVSYAQKQVLFGKALATLFPVRWSESFGRVMIESMACGTPVIGYASVGDLHCGAVEVALAARAIIWLPVVYSIAGLARQLRVPPLFFIGGFFSG